MRIMAGGCKDAVIDKGEEKKTKAEIEFREKKRFKLQLEKTNWWWVMYWRLVGNKR